MDDEYNLHEIARLGEQMEGILKADAFQTGLTLARARIFEGWASSVNPVERENLHAEMRALERLMEGFKTLDDEGAVAREAIRRMQESDDTDL